MKTRSSSCPLLCRRHRRRHDVTLMTTLLSVLLSLSDATWNLYINKTETRRLLGISEDVYYVKNGTVNDYALTFNLPLKGHVKDIYFDWNSFERQEPFYRMTVSSSDPSALEVPLPSIANSGRIPTKPSTFGIRLPCIGYVTSEVDIRIHLNVTSSVTSNTTIVELRRRKTCLKGGSQLLISDADKAQPLASTMLPKDEWTFRGDVVVAMVIGSVVVFGVVVLLVVFYNARKQWHPNDYHLSETNCSRSKARDKNGNKSTSASCTRSLLSASGSPSLRPLPPPALHVDRPMTGAEVIDASQISLGRVVMEGSIGRLYCGVFLSNIDDCQHPVLVKTRKGEVQDLECRLFVSEVNSLRGCHHRNIQPVLTCLLKPVNQPLAVYRFNNDCNLKIYLRTCRASQTLKLVQMLNMVLCICDGLCYLHNRTILHKDVATRNCLVDDCLNVRLTDSVLSSDFFPEDYFVSPTGGRDPVPVRWLPEETLEHEAYDVTSEVWSFGVSAWEVFTFGQQPYSEMGSSEILGRLNGGHRLSSPICCSDETYQLLIDCWCSKPQSRPSLSSLFASFERICARLGQFI